MKVIDGKFDKKEEELTLIAKVVIALEQMGVSEEDTGSFIVITEDASGQAKIGTDWGTVDLVYTLEMMKTVAIMNSMTDIDEDGVVH